MPTSDEFVLPGSVLPAGYAIKLQPDLHNFTFSGQETITIQVAEAVSEIVLNAIELEVASAALNRNGAAIVARDIRLDAVRETVTLDFGQPVTTGRMGPGFDLFRYSE